MKMNTLSLQEKNLF